MLWRSMIPHGELPQPMAAAVSEAALTWACANPEAETVVVWTRSDGRRELEFSPTAGRFLTRAERERALPASREFVLPVDPIRVVQGAQLLPDSDIRYESYAVFGLDSARLITKCGQEFFSPVYQDPADVIRNAVKTATFPETYRAWSDPERIGYWVSWLHRGRRWAGENGQDEDIAFDPDVWQRMKSVDPEIEDLLPDIIADLARMWMVDPDEMLATFRRRSGI